MPVIAQLMPTLQGAAQRVQPASPAEKSPFTSPANAELPTISRTTDRMRTLFIFSFFPFFSCRVVSTTTRTLPSHGRATHARAGRRPGASKAEPVFTAIHSVRAPQAPARPFFARAEQRCNLTVTLPPASVKPGRRKSGNCRGRSAQCLQPEGCRIGRQRRCETEPENRLRPRQRPLAGQKNPKRRKSQPHPPGRPQRPQNPPVPPADILLRRAGISRRAARHRPGGQPGRDQGPGRERQHRRDGIRLLQGRDERPLKNR